MSTLLKKLIFSSLAFLVIFMSVAPNFLAANAATSASPPPTGTWYNSSFGDWYSKVYDENVSPSNEIFGERYTAAQVQWVIYSFFAFILNSTTNTNALNCLVGATKDVQACLKTVLASSDFKTNIALTPVAPKSLVSQVFATRSFSGISYTKNAISKFNLIPEANAASPGFGFDALTPMQDMWKATRDIAFGLFVLAAMILAFMIMFRVKISPQVIISVQSAIPKLIIALILVTFSYAIAGFLVDVMYVVYGILSVMLVNFIPWAHLQPATLFGFLTSGRLFGLPIDLGAFGLVVVYAVVFTLGLAFVLVGTLGVLPTLLAGGITAVILLTPLASLVILLIVIMLLAAIIFLIWTTIKIIISLIKAYVNILLLTVFAPIQIVAGTVVQSMGFGGWMRSFVSNLAIFVVTSVMFYFAFIFVVLGIKTELDVIAGPGTPFVAFLFKIFLGSVLTNPDLSQPTGWPPLIGAGTGALGLLFVGVSFVIFTLIPKANDMIQAFLAGKPFDYGSGLGEAKTTLQGTTSGVIARYEAGHGGVGNSVGGRVLRTIGFIK